MTCLGQYRSWKKRLQIRVGPGQGLIGPCSTSIPVGEQVDATLFADVCVLIWICLNLKAVVGCLEI